MSRPISAQVPIEDRIAICELTSLYSFYCDTRQYERMGSLFCAEGIFDETAVGADRVSRGPAEVAAQMLDFQDHLGPCIHLCSNHLITTFEANSATGSCHVLSEGLIVQNGVNLAFKVSGYYDDRYEKGAGKWLFRSRVLKLLLPYVLVERQQ